MKRFLSILIAIVLLSGISFVQAENSVRFEGDGYASPEEAIYAYADAMSRCDFNDMLSVFALESYVENADPAKVFAAQRTINFHIGLCDTIVVNDEYTYALKLIKRVSTVTDRLYRQYWFFIGDEVKEVIGDSYTRIKDDAEGQYYANLFSEDGFAKIFRDCEIIELASPDQLTDKYSGDHVQRIMDNRCVIYGCDEVRSAAVWLRTPEEVYLLTADFGRYGDRWYMVELGGILGSFLNISQETGGISSYSALRLFEHVE